MQSNGVGKFCSKQFGCNKQLDLLIVDVLKGFYCTKHKMVFWSKQLENVLEDNDTIMEILVDIGHFGLVTT